MLKKYQFKKYKAILWNNTNVKKLKGQKMKRGFTMIELIFVIVIIGILAVIAIPKLNATRDDAKLVTEMQNLSTCVQDIGAAYTATGTEASASSLASCKPLKCFSITDSGNSNGWIKVDKNTTTSNNFCADAQTKAAEKNLDGNISFGGSKVTY